MQEYNPKSAQDLVLPCLKAIKSGPEALMPRKTIPVLLRDKQENDE